MARTLPAAVATAITQTVTEPVYLLQIDFSTTIYLSSREEITWNSKTWTGGNKFTLRYRNTDNGGNRGNIVFANVNNAFSALILNNSIQGTPISIYQYYDSDAVFLLTGIMDNASIKEKNYAANITFAARQKQVKVPNLLMEPPVFNRLIPSEYSLKINNRQYRIDRLGISEGA